MKPAPSTEERIWAVVVHLSAIAMGMGIVLPIVGWSSSRRKSNFASFQSLQALGYQSLGYTIWILLTLVIMIIVTFFDLANMSNIDTLEMDMVKFAFAHTALISGLIILYFLLPIIGAISCALGRDFRYPIMGNRLAKYLGHEKSNESDDGKWLIVEHEDRWVASMGHFAVIVVFWGMFAPITAWAMQGKRSGFLKFQAIQAITFHAVTLVFFFLGFVFYLGGISILFISVSSMDLANLEPSGGMAGLIVVLVSLCSSALILLFIPLLHITGQWAGFRVLKGDDYWYPLVGKIVSRWLNGAELKISKDASE